MLRMVFLILSFIVSRTISFPNFWIYTEYLDYYKAKLVHSPDKYVKEIGFIQEERWAGETTDPRFEVTLDGTNFWQQPCVKENTEFYFTPEIISEVLICLSDDEYRNVGNRYALQFIPASNELYQCPKCNVTTDCKLLPINDYRIFDTSMPDTWTKNYTVGVSWYLANGEVKFKLTFQRAGSVLKISYLTPTNASSIKNIVMIGGPTTQKSKGLRFSYTLKYASTKFTHLSNITLKEGEYIDILLSMCLDCAVVLSLEHENNTEIMKKNIINEMQVSDEWFNVILGNGKIKGTILKICVRIEKAGEGSFWKVSNLVRILKFRKPGCDYKSHYEKTYFEPEIIHEVSCENNSLLYVDLKKSPQCFYPADLDFKVTVTDGGRHLNLDWPETNNILCCDDYNMTMMGMENISKTISGCNNINKFFQSSNLTEAWDETTIILYTKFLSRNLTIKNHKLYKPPTEPLCEIGNGCLMAIIIASIMLIVNLLITGFCLHQKRSLRRAIEDKMNYKTLLAHEKLETREI